MKRSQLVSLLLCCYFSLLQATTSGINSINPKDKVTSPYLPARLCTVFTPSLTNNWSILSSGTDAILNDVHFINADIGWVVGEDGIILKTVDGGENWVSQTSGVTTFLRGVHFIDANIGYAVGNPDFSGEETVLVTTDGGANWVRQSPSGFTTYNDVDIIGSNNGAVVGTESGDGVVLWPSGVDFFNYSNPIFNTELQGVDFVDLSPGFAVGWAVGDGGTIIKSTNGGATWNQQNSPIAQSLFDVNCADQNTCWAVGFNTILNTVDGGTTWSTQTFPQTPPVSFFRSVSFVNPDIGWVVGLNGVILNTNDGGAIWNIQLSGTDENLNSVFFIDSDNGWAVGQNGTILKYSPAPLPIELLSFQGQSLGKQIQLDWKTAFEVNNHGFRVERSEDGEAWVSLGFIAGAGTTSTTQDYTFIDKQSIPGTNYYRLAQVNFDGTVEYTFVISIFQEPKEQNLQIYPNPITGKSLQIIVPTDAVNQYLQLKLYNSSGQVALTRKLPLLSANINLNLSQLPPGVYSLVLFANDSYWSQRVVIKQ